MRNEDKPREVSGVELLINNHQSVKAELDARVENFTICLNLGKELLGRRQTTPRALEVKEKCVQLCMTRDHIDDQWLERWELLQLMLEVYQFARDAAVAEQWLIGQEPYLLNEDLGETLDQVELLIKKHETFEKSIYAQEDRFNALRRLTTLEKRQLRKDTDASLVSSPASTTIIDQDASLTIVDKSVVEQTRLAKYQEEFRTWEERERELNAHRQREREREEQEALAAREADQLRRDKEGNASTRQANTANLTAAELIDVTKALASAGALASTSRLQSNPNTGSPSAQRKEVEIRIEGALSRKHEWESVNKKASNRSWDKVYCVINSFNRYEFYKDQKHFKNNKPLESFSLVGGGVEPAVDYKKKEHVFRLKLNNGGQYLFRARDDDEMQQWINRTQAAINQANGSDSAGGTLSSAQLAEIKTKSLPPLDKRTTSSTSGPGGASSSLRKDFSKK